LDRIKCNLSLSSIISDLGLLFQSIIKKVIDEAGLQDLRRANRDKKIVFCSGCYDILQSGHAVFFSQCKEYGDLLVVGVGRDKIITSLKGSGRPVNSENNRVHLVAAFQDVDFAVLNDHSLTPGKIDFKDVIERLHPDVFILNKDDSGIKEKEILCNRLGIKMQYVSREVPEILESTSTTKIIDKINFAYKAPLRIDLAGGWTDVPYVMGAKTGYVSNMAIKPLVEFKNGKFNFSGYPRGSGLSTSTAAKLLKMIGSKNYNSDTKSLAQISEDLFNLENEELNWAIGRQDQYSIVHGGFSCWECTRDKAERLDIDIPVSTLKEFKKHILLIHTGASRNAQTAVEQVYQNYNTPSGQEALDDLARLGKEFAIELRDKNYLRCAEILNLNFKAQIQLAPASTTDYLSEMYKYARDNGALGGKLAGAGGGGAFIFYCDDPAHLTKALKEKFTDCFELNFEFHYENIKELNRI
jgi:cytidyltransferase-like protein